MAFEAWRETGGSAALDAIVGKVAEELGNTPTVSRKSYVHPAVIAATYAMPYQRISIGPQLKAIGSGVKSIMPRSVAGRRRFIRGAPPSVYWPRRMVRS